MCTINYIRVSYCISMYFYYPLAYANFLKVYIPNI